MGPWGEREPNKEEGGIQQRRGVVGYNGSELSLLQQRGGTALLLWRFAHDTTYMTGMFHAISNIYHLFSASRNDFAFF